MFGIGMQELLIILVLVLVIFGAKRLPEIGAGLGRAIRNFRQGASEPDEIDITTPPKTSSSTTSGSSSNSETIKQEFTASQTKQPHEEEQKK